jgi:hypothetical protein
MDAHSVVKGCGGRVKVLHGLGVCGIVQVGYNIGEQCMLHATERMSGNREFRQFYDYTGKRTRMRRG